MTTTPTAGRDVRRDLDELATIAARLTDTLDEIADLMLDITDNHPDADPLRRSERISGNLTDLHLTIDAIHETRMPADIPEGTPGYTPLHYTYHDADHRPCGQGAADTAAITRDGEPLTAPIRV